MVHTCNPSTSRAEEEGLPQVWDLGYLLNSSLGLDNIVRACLKQTKKKVQICLNLAVLRGSYGPCNKFQIP